eukprot:CAMPEP_0174274906 /NCGR_PEP_ID=MMETSP0439-20130205/59533_1 /TAXON_ID=0 /ORGANISM="Stereomyxa ramosa, Strain Chinc5" /LENGTH=358 /DNA_ID=CAMNT_0015366957 /DNA_START=52 /DNA_END=1128 /DNA_ORIENTATION=+
MTRNHSTAIKALTTKDGEGDCGGGGQWGEIKKKTAKKKPTAEPANEKNIQNNNLLETYHNPPPTAETANTTNQDYSTAQLQDIRHSPKQSPENDVSYAGVEQAKRQTGAVAPKIKKRNEKTGKNENSSRGRENEKVTSHRRFDDWRTELEKVKHHFGKPQHQWQNIENLVGCEGLRYLHPSVTREQCEELLAQGRRNMCSMVKLDDCGVFVKTGGVDRSDCLFFLVRISTSVRGAMVLSHENPAGGFRHFLIPTDTQCFPMTYLHNLNGQTIRHTNLTNLIQQYFQITGIPGIAVMSDLFTKQDLELSSTFQQQTNNQEWEVPARLKFNPRLSEQANEPYYVTDLGELIVGDFDNTVK